MQSKFYKIIDKIYLNDTVCKMTIKAPMVSRKCEPGQFVILRIDENGERIPLTIANFNRNDGTIDIIFQIVGASTFLLSKKNIGDEILDFVGPLGKPTIINKAKNVIIIAGGVGTAIALPITKAYHNLGTNVISIIGFKSKNLVILEDDFKDLSNEIFLTTDDGSYGAKGFVTDSLRFILNGDDKNRIDEVVCIGPLLMMKNVVNELRPYNIPITCSMNSMMIDGTGMCGCCRLNINVDGKKIMKFACVDGPDFNGYDIDFDEAISKSKTYIKEEKERYEETCNLFKGTIND